MKRILSIIFLSVLSCVALSQGTMILRQPTISGESIVFVHANDLWIVDRQGGEAVRLTSGMGEESYPHFSPDGKRIAFSGDYQGNTDVYIVPASGGQPERLTWHPSPDIVQGWTPEGDILFRSSREAYPTRTNRFYSISPDGGNARQIPVPRAAYGEISPDGKYAAYIPITSWDPEWRNYRGGQAMPVWIVDLSSHELIRTPQKDNERHLDPVWLDNKVFYLSERDYTSNIWSFDLKTGQEQQHTFHKKFDVKSLDATTDRIVYEQGGILHLLDPVSSETQPLNIIVRGDFPDAMPMWKDIEPDRLINASLSPTAMRALFEYRGDIFSVPRKKGAWRNLSQTSGSADRYPVWSPDGQQIAWFSDRNNEYQLVISDQMALEAPRIISIPDPSFFFNPSWSPDGKYIAFTDTDYNLWYVEVASGNISKADTERYAHPNRTMNPVWSPDSKWIAYARLLNNQFKAIFVYNLEQKRSFQLTDGMADAITPVWDASGNYLYFLASTNFGLNTGWLDMSSYDATTTRNLYLIVLEKATASPLAPESDEETVAEDEHEEKKNGEEPVEVTIDLENISQRILAIDIPDREYTKLTNGPENTIFIHENIPNTSGQTIHKYDLEKRENEEFLTGVSSFTTSNDRKNALFRKGNSWSIAGTSSAPKNGGDKLSTGDMQIWVDPHKEWVQIYREGWRYQRDFLYVNNVHGAPWNQIYNWYRPWVDHVRHRTDLNYIVDIIGGEVAVGHSYTRGGDIPAVKNIPVGLLGADYDISSRGVRITRIYTGENWNPDLQAPLAGPGIEVSEGDYIVSVNGTPVDPEVNFYAYFENLAGKQIQLAVNSRNTLSDARKVNVIPVRSEYGLRTRFWIEQNRKYVDEASEGQLAYVYLPNTGGSGFSSFNRYYFSQQDRKGAVIDERNNGGGSAADYMVDIMSRQLHGYFNSRANDHKPFTTPMAGIWGPKVMIINERAGSGGDLLPYLFRKMDIGPLIGTRTWGGLVGTWDTPAFIDGGRMVAPRGGFFDLDGEWAVEGVGIAPDIKVIQEPKEVMEGHDPQLERAVEEALELLEKERVELKPEPAPPVRWKRPEGWENDN